MGFPDLIAVAIHLGGKASSAARQATGSSQGFVLDSSKLPLLFLLIGLVSSFVLVRVNTRLIRKGVSWWPGNIESGDLHIHHVVFGFSTMVLAGVLEFAITPTGWTRAIFALIFGGGMGIALDEFALILHIKDVYWTSEGRQSIDAVVIVTAFVAMLIVGLVPLSAQDAAGTSRWALVITIVLHTGFVIVTLFKGKVWTGVIGIFLPFFAWAGAVRLARPTSPWAHRRYREGSRKLERAQERAARSDRRWAKPRNRFFDLIGGKPTPAPAAAPVQTPTSQPAPDEVEREEKAC